MMWHAPTLTVEFLTQLAAADDQVAADTKALGCPSCGGPLHSADYPRKPRGGAWGAVTEQWTVRRSLCCGREGCRRRCTPPSVRFLGRRVYVELTVMLASLLALAARRAKALESAAGVPARTIGRWCAWWRDAFPRTSLFVELQSRTVGQVSLTALPASLLAQFPGGALRQLAAALTWLSPLTTVPHRARCSRGC